MTVATLVTQGFGGGSTVPLIVLRGFDARPVVFILGQLVVIARDTRDINIPEDARNIVVEMDT